MIRELEDEKVVSCRGIEEYVWGGRWEGDGRDMCGGENSQGSWSSCLTHWEVCTHLNKSTPASTAQ